MIQKLIQQDLIKKDIMNVKQKPLQAVPQEQKIKL